MSADDIYAAGFCHGLELAAGESHNRMGKSAGNTSLSSLTNVSHIILCVLYPN